MKTSSRVYFWTAKYRFDWKREKKTRKRVAGVVTSGSSLGRLISLFVPSLGVLLYGNRISVRRKLSPEAGYLPTTSANWLHRAMRRDATRRVAARVNGVVCRVRGSQPDGKRALLLAECRESTPGTSAAGTRGWETRTCARRSVRAHEIAEVR